MGRKSWMRPHQEHQMDMVKRTEEYHKPGANHTLLLETVMKDWKDFGFDIPPRRTAKQFATYATDEDFLYEVSVRYWTVLTVSNGLACQRFRQYYHNRKRIPKTVTCFPSNTTMSLAPKLMKVWQAYYQMENARLLPLLMAAWKTHRNGNPKAKWLSFRSTWLKAEYAKEPQEMKDKVEEYRQKVKSADFDDKDPDTQRCRYAS